VAPSLSLDFPRSQGGGRGFESLPVNQFCASPASLGTVLHRRSSLNRFAGLLGKIWERTQSLKSPGKSHRINRPHFLVRSHNPKVVSSNLTPATIQFVNAQGVAHQGQPLLLWIWAHLGAKFGPTAPRTSNHLHSQCAYRVRGSTQDHCDQCAPSGP
jgi:hypothetical protein